MNRRVVLEAVIVKAVMHALKSTPGVVVRKRHGTAMGVAGDPDLYGTIRGRHFELELKRPNDPSSQLTKLQTLRLQEWNLAGAITGVARSLEEALTILGIQPKGREPEVVWLCAGCRTYRWLGAEAPARCPLCKHLHFEMQQAEA
jgi:hypothetical protein